jgi:hypothetical protein
MERVLIAWMHSTTDYGHLQDLFYGRNLVLVYGCFSTRSDIAFWIFSL